MSVVVQRLSATTNPDDVDALHVALSTKANGKA
jgi:hypothetical protein